MFEILKKHHIYCRKYFSPLVSEYRCYRDRFGVPEQTPTALTASVSVLTLPMYADLPMEDVDKICELIRKTGGK